jgi:DNA-binding transcriptional MocR family regulator
VDDAFGLLGVAGAAAPTVHELLCARGASELAVYLSSFSKSVAPGLRVGYVVAPEALAGALAADARALYLSPPVLAQAQLHEFLDRGELEPHLAHVRELLRGRRDALLDVFARRLPVGAAWTRPDGGYFLWLELPPPLEMAVVLSRAAGVACVPGTDFFAGEGGRNAARVSFSYPTVDAVRTGAERLADAIAATAPAAG